MDLNKLENEMRNICQIGMESKDEGIKLCDSLLNEYEEDTVKGIVKFYKALIYEKHNDINNALKYYEESVKLGLTIDSLNRIYTIYQKENNLVFALDTIDRMIALEPEVFYGYDLKFNFLFSLKVFEEAEKVLKLTEELFEKSSIITLNRVRINSALGRLSESLEIIELEKDNEEIRDDLLIEKAKILAIEGDLEEATVIIKNVQAKYSDNVEIIYLLGTVYMMSGRMEEAKETLELLVNMEYKEDLNYLTGLYYYGVVLKSFKDKEEVKKYFNWLKRKYSIFTLNNPKDLNVKIFNSIIHYELENYTEALRVIKTLDEVSREIPEVYFIKALIYKGSCDIDRYERTKNILKERYMMYFKILESIDKLEG